MHCQSVADEGPHGEELRREHAHDHRKSSFKEYRMLHYNIGIKLATLKDAHVAKQRLFRIHHGSHRTASITVS
jgi:hypothetical protein